MKRAILRTAVAEKLVWATRLSEEQTQPWMY